MYKVIITYELIFLAFWNILYLSNSDVENWFTEKFLTAIFVFFSTMALGLTLVYIIYVGRMSIIFLIYNKYICNSKCK